MLNIKDLRHNLLSISTSLAKKKFILNNELFVELDERNRSLLQQVEKLQCERNNLAKQISKLDKTSSEFKDCITKSKQVNHHLAAENQQYQEAKELLYNFLLNIPNIPDAIVPHGDNESDNKIIRTWGDIPQFDFPIKDHIELGTPNANLDFATAANVSSNRFVVMQGYIARLHRALIQFMLDIHTTKHGYKEVYIPQIVNDKTLLGSGQLPKFAADLFELKTDRKLFLIPTAEVVLVNLCANKTLGEADVPLKFTAHSACYRSEAGSYGRDTTGLIRQHQFDKVELVQFVSQEESNQALESIVQNAETILKLLQLPYRVSLLCGGDLGFAASKTYDIEVWLPGQNKYREISSCSNCGDFQTRRINAKLLTKDKKTQLLHSLNGSGLAVGRTLIAILENYQLADSSVVTPKVLEPYMQSKC